MKIKQVEELVGITKKNIRFYEEQGLLEVKRAENGYREYSLSDVKRLQEIRLLRKLSISIEDMRQMFGGKKSLRSCLEYQVEDMERQKKNIRQIVGGNCGIYLIFVCIRIRTHNSPCEARSRLHVPG